MFTETQTRALLGEICRSLGLSGSQARLLRHHTKFEVAGHTVTV